MQILSILLSFLTLSSFAKTPLQEGWQIQDSLKVSENGEMVSTENFLPLNWHRASVPSTVQGSLVDETPSQDPFYEKNMTKLSDQFDRAWWYRKTFSLSKRTQGKVVELHFQGINYSAEIWFNGKKLADKNEIVGTYRTYTFDVTKLVHLGGLNTVAVLVSRPSANDLTPSWVDWNPTPLDRNMGLWREVFFTTRGNVGIADPQVITHLDAGTAALAHLTVEAELTNASDTVADGELQGTIGNAAFAQKIKLSPHEVRVVQFKPSDYKTLNIKNPKLWWPAQMGLPELNTLQLKFKTNDGTLSDENELKFGIREVTSSLTTEGARLFKINGKPILIRGGGWASDLFLRFSPERLEKEFAYVQDLHLNTVRLEGQFQPEYFYERADQLGILVMPGWVCCNQWEKPDQWTETTYKIANASLHDSIRLLRAHPSVFVFLYGSDNAPPERTEAMYLKTFADEHWPNPVLAAASSGNNIFPVGPHPTPTPFNSLHFLLGDRTGVKMTGPYDYVPPSYWYVDKDRFGGAWGFNTETSPGPAVPPIETIKTFISSSHLWPMDEVWTFHAGQTEFKDIHVFINAFNKRYGEGNSAEEFAMKAQTMSYDDQRAMFEAYGKKKYHSATGVIQWMLNNAWPSLIWHLYDYRLRPGGSYFGVKKATEAIHIQYSYDDQSIVVVNSTYDAVTKLTAKTEVFDFNLNKIFGSEKNIDIGADQSNAVLTLPPLENNLSKIYFVKLGLNDASGKTISSNFYWLSTQTDIYDWEKTDFTHTPTLQEADFTELSSLPTTKLAVSTQLSEDDKTASVTVQNKGTALAFSIRLKLLDSATKDEVLPVLWDDNYFSLMPGETKVIGVRYPLANSKSNTMAVTASAWNVVETKSKMIVDHGNSN